MNPDLPRNSREKLEAGLTALLLGELPPDQAAELRRAIEQDAALAALHQRLKLTIDLVRQTALHPAADAAAPPVLPKLSERRRQELLAHFKTVTPKEFVRPRRQEWRLPVLVAAAAVLVGLLALQVFLPVVSPSKRRSRVMAAAAAKPVPDRSSVTQYAGAYGGYAWITTNIIPYGSPEWAEAKAKQDAERALIASPPGLAPVPPTLEPPAAPGRGLGSESERESLAPAPSNRTAIVLPGSDGANETTARTVRPGAPPSGGRSLSETAAQAEAPGSGGPVTRTFELSHADPNADVRPEVARASDQANANAQGVQPIPQEVFQRSGSIRAGSSNDRSSMLGAGNPLVQRETQQMPRSVAAGGVFKPAAQPAPGGSTPGQPAAVATPLQDQIPILGDKPVIGRRFRDERAQAAAKDARSSTAPGVAFSAPQIISKQATEEVELKKRDLSIGLALSDSSAKGLPAQDKPVGGVTAAVPDASLPMRRTVGRTPAAQPATATIGDAYFSIDPESVRVFTNADETTQMVISNLDRQHVTNVNKAPAAAAFAGRYAFIVPSVPTNVNALDQPVSSLAEARAVDQLSAAPLPPASAVPRVEPDQSIRKPLAGSAPILQPEVQTRENALSTFSLNVSDVSFKLAAASLEQGRMPEPATVRSEEFINAFDYRDSEAPAGVPVTFACDRARYPFAQNRDLVRFSLKTAAQGRQAGQPLNVVLLLDNSGSMERADRVRIIHEALRVLAAQLQPQDTFSVVTFARTARLWVDGAPGNQAGRVAEELSGLTPQGGTNLEEAMNLAYQTALRHFLANGINRVVLLTDGAANLGSVQPEALKQKVEAHRKRGIALDCFGIGWEGYNDDLLEVLSRNGDGRYGFLNTPEQAATEFAGQLAGALRVAASEVKVQVRFNPARVRAYRQIGYARRQLAKEQFRDNTVAAAQMGAAESGNALYVIETDPRGNGPLGVVRVRYRIPGTSDYREQEWTAPYTGSAAPLEQASAALRLAAVAGAFSEWLVSSPFAGEVTPERLLGYLRGVPDVYGPDARPRKLEWMLRQAQSLGGK
jgi:Mg-chelatase subunit ChlD